jgi:hypothetical protein
MPSTPAAAHRSTAGSGWACAVTGSVRLVDDGAHLVEGELTAEDVGGRGHHPAAGHHLDDVGAPLHPLADGPAQVVDPGDLPAQPPAVPTHGGDRRAGGDHGRARSGAAVPVHHRPGHVPQVPDGGDPGGEVPPQGGGDDQVDRRGVQLGQLVQRPRAAVRAEVDVGVDQAGQQGGTGEFGDRAALRRARRRRFHADDRAGLHEDQGAAGQHPLAVEGPFPPVAVHGRPPASRGIARPRP